MSLVLAVDDSPALLALLVRCLKQGGHDVVSAKNGQQALEMLQTHKPHIVVTDLNMPLMSGLDFIEAARAEPEGQGVPILLLTSETAGSLHERARRIRATGWLPKPLDGPRLLALVADLA
jgi:two-component system, chemotaxis family, chemotaxis protein CheY